MAARVYIETTVVSYLTARASTDVIREGHQRITRNWWNRTRLRFDLYVSELTIREA
ncbi:MAG TPA: hypothetical protein VGS41_05830 [Chthonomonadales bacterium]|nr:hypothetical protein [Chthonomonadales bacterium]